MSQTALQRSFAPFKRFPPAWTHNSIRSLATAAIAPVLWAYRVPSLRAMESEARARSPR